MKRENRYLIIKRSDLEKVGITRTASNTINFWAEKVELFRKSQGKPPLECVVVESDWPEYELVWELIRLRVEKAQIPAETVQGIVDAPAVNSALCAFYDDATNDNAFALVRAVMEACLPRAPETFDSVEEGLAATKDGETFNVSKVEFSPAWDGEGLPPVGATVEYSFANGYGRSRLWTKGIVNYVSERVFVYTDDEGTEWVVDAAGSDIKYRTYMTPEERYERRKAKAVKAMMDICDAPASEGLTREGMLEIIYAAIAAGDIAGVPAIKDDE